MKTESRKKRILFHYMIGGTAGGSDSCLFLLLKYLDLSKYEPYLLYNKKSAFVQELKDIGINLIPFSKRIQLDTRSQSKNTALRNSRTKKKSGKLKLLLGSLKNLIKRMPEIIKLAGIIIENRIDIVHTNHYLTGDRSMLLASIFLRKKIVSHNRGLYSPDLFDRYISKYIDRMVCMSDFSKSVYVKNGVSEAKCKTIYDGIDVVEFISSEKESKTILIGCIGRLEKWKGQQVLVEAAEALVKTIPEIKFLFVGDGGNEDELKNKVKSNGLEKYFEFTGHVTNVKDYMDKCTIIVHTSIEPEPFGMVIIEAMALEKPVIATNFGGPIEIIDNEKDGFLIPPQNPELLAESILKLIENPSLRKQMGKKAREKVIAKFNVRDYTKQIELVYEEISNKVF